MTRLYLITHAHTEQRRDVDATTWTLSGTGRVQAATLAEQTFWAEVERIALSSEPKTRLTVEPLLRRRGFPVVVDARFDELRRPAVWNDDYVARVAEVFATPAQSIGGWEAAGQALARFQTGIEYLRASFKGQTLALVGHGLTLSLYRAHLLGQMYVDLNAWRALSFASVALVDLQTDKLIADFRPVAGSSPRG